MLGEVDVDAEVCAGLEACGLQAVACEDEEAPSPHREEEEETTSTTTSDDAMDDPAVADEADACSICLEPVTNGFTTPCGHAFCSPCLAQALFRNDSCPVCRRIGVHTCSSFSEGCSLCVAGHKPGVVMPNVFVSELTVTYASSAREITLIWLQVLALATVLVVAGFTCIIGALPFPAFGTLCALVTVANFCLVVARFRRLQRIRAQYSRYSRRGRRDVRPGPAAAEYDVERAQNPGARRGGASGGGIANSVSI